MKKVIKPKRQHCSKEHKVIFATELDVKIELANHQYFGTESRSYPCPFGNHFHITTQERRNA